MYFSAGINAVIVWHAHCTVVQDRVTEHRGGITVWGVVELMSGGETLDNVLETLKAHNTQQNLATLLEQIGE